MNIQIYLFDCLQPLFDEIERDVGSGQVGPRDLLMMMNFEIFDLTIFLFVDEE